MQKDVIGNSPHEVHNELEENDQMKIKFESIHHHHPLSSSSPELAVERPWHSQTISG